MLVFLFMLVVTGLLTVGTFSCVSKIVVIVMIVVVA